MTALRSPRTQVPAHELDGLTGRTEQQRREIEARIGRVSEAKARVEGRPLTPFEIALALGLADDRTPRRPCTSCRSLLPDTPEFFHRNGPGLHRRCKPCMCRRNAAGPKKPRVRTESYKQYRRDYNRRYRERRIAAGLPDPQCASVRGLLLKQRVNFNGLLRRASDPGRIEALKARIADLTHEIDRIDREAAQ